MHVEADFEPEHTGLLCFHVPDYFSYYLQSEVIFTPQSVPDYCGVVKTTVQSGIKIATLRCSPV